MRPLCKRTYASLFSLPLLDVALSTPSRRVAKAASPTFVFKVVSEMDMRPVLKRTYASLFQEERSDGGASELRERDRCRPLPRRSSIYAVVAGRESRLMKKLSDSHNSLSSLAHCLLPTFVFKVVSEMDMIPVLKRTYASLIIKCCLKL